MASRRGRDDHSEETAGQDSFLDLVANIVGILILLVVIVGVRAATSGIEEGPTADGAPQQSITDDMMEGLARDLHKTRAETLELAHKTALAEREAEELDAQRIGLVEYVTNTENQLKKLRDELSDQQREEFDVNLAIAQAEQRLDELVRAHVSLVGSRVPTKTLRNVPTPIVQKSTHKEITVWVNGGLVSIVPSDELDQLVISDIQRRRHLSTDISRVGPLNGFQLHYAIVSKRISIPGGVVESRGVAGEYRPVDGQRGEPISIAHTPDSNFAAHLARFDPKGTVVTFWTSVNSFGEIGQLREFAAKQGFSTAVRPLPEGRYIGFAPGGTETRAQ